MSAQSIVARVVSVTSNLVPSQSGSFAAIGRAVAGDVAVEHTIKRACRSS